MTTLSARGLRKPFAVAAFDHGEPVFRPTYPTPAAGLSTVLLALAVSAACVLRPHVVSLPLVNRPNSVEEGSGRTAHTLRLTDYGMILWDGEPTNQGQLVANLRKALAEPLEADVVFVPDANASYELSVQVLAIVTAAGATRLSLSNICVFRAFGKTPKSLPLTTHIPAPEESIVGESSELPMPADCDWQGETLEPRD